MIDVKKKIDMPLRLIDVGGQQSERRKWLSVFKDIDCVIFLVAINEYDMVLEEDPTKNRLFDSLSLWHQLTGFPDFAQTPWMLFFNKSDLFEKKIKEVHPSKIFEHFDAFVEKPEFAKLTLLEQSWKFFAYNFTKRYRGKEGALYLHLTSVIDSDCCKKVWGSVLNELRKGIIYDTGLIM